MNESKLTIKQIINIYDQGKSLKVNFKAYNYYSGGYQIKDNHDVPADDKVIEWINKDNYNSFDLWGDNYNENKLFYGPWFYVGVDQHLDTDWVMSKLKIFATEPDNYWLNRVWDFEASGVFLEYLDNEYDCYMVGDAEFGMSLNNAKQVSLSKPYLGSEPFKDDIDFAVSEELEGQDFELFFEI